MLVSLAAEGKLALTDPLQRYVRDTKVPTFGAHPITLLDLATHSAGLPREMGGTPPDVDSRGLADARGSLEMAARLQAALGTLHHRRIFQCRLRPFGRCHRNGRWPILSRSAARACHGTARHGGHRLRADSRSNARLMIGTGLGGAGPCVDTHATDGSGGLYSTGNDMARWLRHNIEDTDGTLALSHAVYRQRQGLPAAIGFDEAGPMAGLGLGWVISWRLRVSIRR